MKQKLKEKQIEREARRLCVHMFTYVCVRCSVYVGQIPTSKKVLNRIRVSDTITWLDTKCRGSTL